jgi:hypothetical protein
MLISTFLPEITHISGLKKTPLDVPQGMKVVNHRPDGK